MVMQLIATPFHQSANAQQVPPVQAASKPKLNLKAAWIESSRSVNAVSNEPTTTSENPTKGIEAPIWMPLPQVQSQRRQS